MNSINNKNKPIKHFSLLCISILPFVFNIVNAQITKKPSSLSASASSDIVSSQPTVFYDYVPNKVYSVPTGLGIATQIILDQSDKIKDFGTGFSTGWDIVRRDNIIYIKPKDPDAETNMYIKTEKRSYLLDLKIVTKDWRKIDEAKNLGVAYLVQFNYRDVKDAPTLLTESVKKNAESPVKSIYTPIKPVFQKPHKEIDVIKKPDSAPYFSYYTNYEVAAEAGVKWMVPIRVYDDGEVTYIQMPKSQHTPSFFGRLSDRGEEFVLNRSLKKGINIVHGVYPFIIIRYGAEVVAIRRR